MGYSEYDIQRVRKAADIRDFIPGIEYIARRAYARCPQCGAEHKEGMIVTHNAKLDLAKCFRCGFSVNGAINAVMLYRNASFPEAVKAVAEQYGIDILTEHEQRLKEMSQAKKRTRDSFCHEQLTASGLTIEDVTARVTAPDGTVTYTPTFKRGSMSLRTGTIDPNADEMLIYYYDLYGMQMRTPSPSRKSVLMPYVRLRRSNPEAYTAADGRPAKYLTLPGSEARFYIPQKIRDAFAAGQHIDTLFIQEGEKKAEKACKHGMMSIAIQGIYNIGSKEAGLIQDLQYLVKKCTVKNVVLIFDSDWDHLHSSLSSGDDIDQRPNQFAKAAIKFKTYVQTLHNSQLFVDIWFGHVNANVHGEKGIDDLLTGSLKGSEQTLIGDIAYAMNAHDGKASHITIHKISPLTDHQIFNYWLLRSPEEFFARHADELKPLQYFRFGRVNYRRGPDGIIVKASAQGSDKDYWQAYTNDKGKKIIEFDHLAAFSFLEGNGFYRIYSEEIGEKQYEFVKIENSVVRAIGTHTIRDFAYAYALQNCKDRDILNYLASSLGSLLGNDRLERLKMLEDNFELYEPDSQNRFYANGQLRITAHAVTFGPMMGMAWRTSVIQRRFRRIPIFRTVERTPSGAFAIDITEAGTRCEFLQFLMHASDFWKGRPKTADEAGLYTTHIVNKLTAIGYLLTDYKYGAEKKAVVAVDGKMSEVGTSNGRSGKSLIGVAISQILQQEFIDGKSLRADDEFMFGEVTLRTRNIFIDDVKVNFDFTRLYAAITGKLKVNPKQAARFTIPFEKAPKFYITTNHAINDASDSSRARLAYMSFSDWYNVSWSPVNDFGHEFFEPWDDEQWSLFDNLMAECVSLYLRSRSEEWTDKGAGILPPPMEDIEARQLRQKMGEAFLQWAESVFDDPSGPFLNCRKNRKELYDHFSSEYPGQRQFISPASFRERVICFCRYRGLHFNPHKPTDRGDTFRRFIRESPGKTYVGGRDNSGGTVYFTVATPDYARHSIP